MAGTLTAKGKLTALLAIALGFGLAAVAAKAGHLEDEHELSMELVTPHTKWAKPYAGGKVRALFFSRFKTRDREARDIIELMQRFDIEADAAYYLRHPAEWLGGEEGHQRRLRLLEKPYDVYVFSYIAPRALTDEEQYKVLKAVTEGAGIVLIGAGDNRILKAKSKLPDRPAFLSAGECYAVGKGRGVNLPGRKSSGYRVGWEVELDYQIEQQGRALLWAAKREPQMTLSKMQPEQVSRGLLPLPMVSVKWADAPTGTTMEAVLRCGDGLKTLLARQDCGAASGTLKLTIPIVRAGDYHVDVIARSKRGVEAWTTMPLTVTSSRAVKAVTLDKDWGEIGDRIGGKVEVSGALEAGDRVIVRLVDRRGRILQRRESRIKGLSGTFTFRIRDWMPMLLRVEAAILSNGKEVASAYQCFRVTKRKRGTFHFVMWDHPKYDYAPYGMESLAKLGVTSVLGPKTPALILSAFDMAVVPYTTWLGGDFSTLAASLDKDGVMKTARKSLCWNDEVGITKHVAEVVEKSMGACRHGAYLYSLGDEVAVRSSCLSPHCLKAYRRYLKQQYGKVGALNKSWGTNFASFDDVTLSQVTRLPAPDAPEWFKAYYEERIELYGKLHTGEKALDENAIRNGDENDEIPSLQAENYPRWYDRQAFQCYNLVKFSERFAKAFLKVDPQARTGFEGTHSFQIPRHPTRIRHGGDLDLIIRDLGWFGPYPGTENEVVRSVSPADFPCGNWMGYSKDPGPLISKYWMMIVKGMTQVQWWRWDGVGQYHGYLAPHLGMYPEGRELFKDTQIVRDGLGTLLMKSRMLDDGIAMLYSMPSTYMAHFDGNRTYCDYRRDHQAWFRAIRDAGLEFRYVTDRMLRLGEFDAKRYKVLVLPFAVAVGEKEAEVIRSFVRGGGTVIADVRPGIYDGHCKLQGDSVLDEVFGIVREGKKEAMGAAVAVDGAVGERSIALDWPRGKVDPTVRLSTGRALGRASTVPVCIVNEFGMGRAVLLNFPLQTAPADELVQTLFAAAGVRPRLALRTPDGSAPGGLEVGRWQNGNIELMSLYGRYEGKVSVTLPQERHVYDLRRRKALGKLKTFSTDLRTLRANFFALLPEQSPPVSVLLPGKMVQAGTVVKALVSVPGAAGQHAVRIRVKTPSGRPADWHNQVVIVDGKGKNVLLPVAHNDPTGEWTITALDLFTDKATTTKLTIQ